MSFYILVGDSPPKLPEERLYTDHSFECPWDVAIDEQDNIYVLDNQSLHVLDRKGQCLETTSRDIPGNAGGIAVRENDLTILDMDRNTCQIYRSGSSGDLRHVSSWMLIGRYAVEIKGSVRGVAMDHNENLYVTDPRKHSLDKYSPGRALLGRIQTGQVYPGLLAWYPGHGLLTVDMVNKTVCLLTPADGNGNTTLQ